MPKRGTPLGRVVLLCLLAASLAVFACSGGEERAIRARLEALVAEANRPPAEGLGLVAHAATTGEYFTEDATVDLGPGTARIEGRDMLIGMVARLQPRMAAYRARLDDMDIRLAEGGRASVAVTVSITPRSPQAPMRWSST
jgi:hypothetical protein